MSAKSSRAWLTLLAAVILTSPAWAVHRNGARSDTTWYGRYVVASGEYYAVPYALKGDAVWTFDRGIGPIGDPDRIDGGEGWTAIDLTPAAKAALPFLGEAGIADFDCYGASTACLSNNVLEVHAGTCDQGYHPALQYLRLESPICDLGADWDDVFLEYDRYWEIADGALFWRCGWRYFPAAGSGGDHWSDRVGSDAFWVASGTECVRRARVSASPYIPSSAQKVIAVIEIATPEAFGMPPMPTDFPVRCSTTSWWALSECRSGRSRGRRRGRARAGRQPESVVVGNDRCLPAGAGFGCSRGGCRRVRPAGPNADGRAASGGCSVRPLGWGRWQWIRRERGDLLGAPARQRRDGKPETRGHAVR